MRCVHECRWRDYSWFWLAPLLAVTCGARPTRLADRVCCAGADGFLILLRIEREKRRIPCQDADLVDFMQVIR